MDGYSAVAAVGRVATGETDVVFMPRSPRTGKRGVVLMHGYQGTATNTWVNGLSKMLPLAATLASNGIVCVAADLGGNDYANDDAMTKTTAAFALLVTLGCASDRFGIYGLSMGAGTGIRYAELHPDKVSAVYGTAPMVDINDIYTNDRAGARAAVGTAWGVTYPTPLPAGADLPGQAPLASAIPLQLDYSTADSIILPSLIATLQTAWGANCSKTVISSTDDHGDTLFGKTDPAGVVRFMKNNGS